MRTPQEREYSLCVSCAEPVITIVTHRRSADHRWTTHVNLSRQGHAARCRHDYGGQVELYPGDTA